MQSQQQLNQQFAIDDQLNFELNEAGIVVATITNQFATVSLSTYGGHVLSYLPVGEPEDVFFISDQAVYGQGKAIRGGIPVCWPWFAEDMAEYGKKPHGFARNQQWNVIATKANQDGSTEISLALSHTEASLAVWPYEFSLVLEVVVGESLHMTLTTENLSQKPFTITQALHTYLNVSDIHDIEIVGLDNMQYLDKLTHFSEKSQQGDITVDGEIDRVYLDPPAIVTLSDTGFERDIVMTSSGNKTLVVWNPGPETVRQLSDIDAAAYKDFICIETANAVVDKVLIESGQQHSLTAVFQVKKSQA
jgi:glucose-6-phosphate 1-epimerase